MLFQKSPVELNDTNTNTFQYRAALKTRKNNLLLLQYLLYYHVGK